MWVVNDDQRRKSYLTFTITINIIISRFVAIIMVFYELRLKESFFNFGCCNKFVDLGYPKILVSNLILSYICETATKLIFGNHSISFIENAEKLL